MAQAGGARLAEGSSSSAAEATLAGAAVPVMPLVQEERRYYVADHLGSVRAVFDQSGTVVEATDYYVFGLEMPGRVFVDDAERAREGYTGHEKDVDTGLYYAGARYLDAGLGRWHAPDPLAGAMPGWSPYNYGFNDPVGFSDPDGKQPCPYDPSKECGMILPTIVVTPKVERSETMAGTFALGLVVTHRVGRYDLGTKYGEMASVGGSALAAIAVGSWLHNLHNNPPPVVYPVPPPPVVLNNSDTSVDGADAEIPSFDDPTTAPQTKDGQDFEWRGRSGSVPGSKEGSYYNPQTGEVLRPDLGHAPPIGPHWDYKDPSGQWWRVGRSGSKTMK